MLRYYRTCKSSCESRCLLNFIDDFEHSIICLLSPSGSHWLSYGHCALGSARVFNTQSITSKYSKSLLYTALDVRSSPLTPLAQSDEHFDQCESNPLQNHKYHCHRYHGGHSTNESSGTQCSFHRKEENIDRFCRQLLALVSGGGVRPVTPSKSRLRPSALAIKSTSQIPSEQCDPRSSKDRPSDRRSPNYTLSQALRADLPPEMFEAEEIILKHGIPSARKARIQIIWLNWGLTDEDLLTLPPQQFRVFGWRPNVSDILCGIDFRKASIE